MTPVEVLGRHVGDQPRSSLAPVESATDCDHY